jgi:hypothetical protein
MGHCSWVRFLYHYAILSWLTSLYRAAAGWVDTVDLFGSKKLSLAQLLEPAITLAEEGFPVAPVRGSMSQVFSHLTLGGRCAPELGRKACHNSCEGLILETCF